MRKSLVVDDRAQGSMCSSIQWPKLRFLTVTLLFILIGICFSYIFTLDGIFRVQHKNKTVDMKNQKGRRSSDKELWRLAEPLDDIIADPPWDPRATYKTYIVYHAYIYEINKFWDQLISAQLQNLNSNGLSANATSIYVHLSTRYADEFDTKVANGVR